MKQRFFWTLEKEEELKNLWNSESLYKLAIYFHTTENNIREKSSELGLPEYKSNRWTKEEEIVLSDLWGAKSVEFIAKKLKRTVFSLKVKAVRMGLGPMIRNNYDLITISDICELLNVSRDRITRTWLKLGLNLKQTKLTKDRSYYTVTWKDLMEFLEYNQNEWDSRNVDLNMLGIEPQWLKDKRKRDKIENPLWYRKWTEEEINQTELLFKQGKNYKEISAIIDRSEWSVANLLRNLGYSYRLPQYWKGNELKYLRENYENMTYYEIANVLGRTYKSVEAKSIELGYQKRLVKFKDKDGEKNE